MMPENLCDFGIADTIGSLKGFAWASVEIADKGPCKEAGLEVWLSVLCVLGIQLSIDVL